jgi:hypothetical protein
MLVGGWSSGGWLQGLLAEVAQGVVAAAGQLAGGRQQGALAVDPLPDPAEVGVAR